LPGWLGLSVEEVQRGQRVKATARTTITTAAAELQAYF